MNLVECTSELKKSICVNLFWRLQIKMHLRLTFLVKLLIIFHVNVQATDPNVKSSQILNKVLPLVIGYFALSVPSGLSLYW
jgi:membrane protein insertase Oxa1/YidC/SpoIIIJ